MSHFPARVATPDLSALADEAHANSRDHGFWDDPPSIERSMNLVHTELSELVEDLRAGKRVAELTFEPPSPPGSPDLASPSPGKPVGPASELADVAIRLLDFAGAHRLNVAGSADLDKLASNEDEDSWISDLHKAVADIAREHERLTSRGRMAPGGEAASLDRAARFEMWRQNPYWHNNMSARVFTALSLVAAFARAYEVPIWEVVRLKMDFNKTRPRKHGGKAF